MDTGETPLEGELDITTEELWAEIDALIPKRSLMQPGDITRQQIMARYGLKSSSAAGDRMRQVAATSDDWVIVEVWGIDGVRRKVLRKVTRGGEMD